MVIILQLIIDDEDVFSEELERRINQSLSECLMDWKLEEYKQEE